MILSRTLLCLTLAVSAYAQTKPAAPTVCEPCLRSEIEYLASDTLRGRGSGTADELTAATHIAEAFQKLGLETAQGGNYIIPVTLERSRFTAPPQLKFNTGGQEVVWTHGKEMIVRRIDRAQESGKLFHSNAKTDPAKIPDGSVVALDLPPSSDMRQIEQLVRSFEQSHPALLILPATAQIAKYWDQFASRPVMTSTIFPGAPTEQSMSIVVAKPEALAELLKVPEGTEVSLGGTLQPDPLHTRNVVAILRGSDPKLKDQFVMFSAHMDHLGVRGTTGDTIYNGADDDASGTATVLELARIFTKGQRPKRGVMFVTFGSEELGLLGSRALAANPPVPLESIVAAIEFEQTGLPQEKMDGQFWMTGSQLSDLRSELEKHGSTIADDPYPGNPFFRQSDNFSLAAKGVVAHTVSGAAEFPDYHKPGDEANKLNYDFMAKALQQALPGFEWLVNSDTRPIYFPGKNPAEK